MRPRQRHRLLVALAAALFVLQVSLWLGLRSIPPPEPPPPPAAPRPAHVPMDPPASDSDAEAVVVLDLLLMKRLEEAAARRGRDVASVAPPPALREAALAEPSPDGPAVQALIEAYGAGLAALGESLDATSSPGSAAGP